MPDIIAYHVLGARAPAKRDCDDAELVLVHAYYALLGVQFGRMNESRACVYARSAASVNIS